MATLLNLVEEALLISDKLESLLKKEELGQFISDEVMAERIIQLKIEIDANPEPCSNLKKVTDVLFQSAQAYKKAITPEQAKEAIKSLQPGFNIDFQKYVECDFMLNISDFIAELRVKGFQKALQQISRESVELTQELTQENNELRLENQQLKEENKKLKRSSFLPAAKAPTTQIAQALFGKKNLAPAMPEEINVPKHADKRELIPT